jgi:hypothetical protein
MRMGEAKGLMGLLPKLAVMVSQRPPVWRPKRERISCRALMYRYCLRPDIEVQLPATCLLIVHCPHMGQRRVGFCKRRCELCTPCMNSCLCVNWIFVREVWFFWNDKSAPFEAGAGKEGAMLGGRRKGCTSVFDAVLMWVGFEVSVSEGCGFTLCTRDECARSRLGADRHI